MGGLQAGGVCLPGAQAVPQHHMPDQALLGPRLLSGGSTRQGRCKSDVQSCVASTSSLWQLGACLSWAAEMLYYSD